MTTKEIKESIIEMIACKEFEIINEKTVREYKESKYIKDFTRLTGKNTTLTVLLDLTKYFNKEEQQEIKQIKEIEFNNINYTLNYKEAA